MAAALKSTSEVIDALGGTTAVARRAGVDARVVSNWRLYPAFPAKTYLFFQAALAAHNRTFGTSYAAPNSLWAMIPPPAEFAAPDRISA